MGHDEILFAGIADELEISPVGVNADTKLEPWDSLNVIGVMALVDDLYGITIDGSKLTECKTFGDVLKLVEGT